MEDKKQVMYDLNKLRVVLIRDSSAELGFRILTSFPLPQNTRRITIIDEKQLNKLRYFLEGYLNVSADYSELDTLIKEYKEIENKEYIKDLKEEINLVLSANNIEFVRDFIRKYGMRNIKKDDKIIWLLNHIKDNV